MSRTQVLIVHDVPGQVEILRFYLNDLSLDVEVAGSPAAAIQALSHQPVHAVLCDLLMPGGGGLEVLRFVRSHGLSTPVIIITGQGGEESVEACVAAGAFDFLARPIDRLAVGAVLRRALLRSGLVFEERLAPASAAPRLQYPDLVGTSAAMQEVLARVAKVAEADTNVCLYGESGTGKELVARAIHATGPRAAHPLVVMDCAAIPEGLMESELFGHVKGAFTSAARDREGVFQLADGGTLLLDEVGELSPPLQAKLLRVIQCREFRPVGGKQPLRVNVRIIAATNRDLRAMVGEGRFREDLFYRLDVIPITLPPLRDRKEDIPHLVEHFVEKFNRSNRKQIRGCSDRTIGTLLRYHWPGNIRELENCIERAAVMADGDTLDIADLDQILHPTKAQPFAPPPRPETSLQSLKDVERDLILRTLESVQGNRTRAAELLGISLRGLQYKLKALREEEGMSGEGIPLGSRLVRRPPGKE
jgi:DNA-binding NtrC family response regulator